MFRSHPRGRQDRRCHDQGSEKPPAFRALEPVGAWRVRLHLNPSDAERREMMQRRSLGSDMVSGLAMMYYPWLRSDPP